MAAAGQSTGHARNSRWERLGRWLRRRRTRRDAARALYLTLVEQARQPVFYATWGVPDSRDGRLEMVGLHAILVMRRLRSEGRQGRLLAQALFDLMFRDVDRHLREWGVGDLSVGKQVKKLAHNFLGRAQALDPLLDGSNPTALEAMLGRNVYTEISSPPPQGVASLASYLCDQVRGLGAQDGSAMLTGRVAFADPQRAGGDRDFTARA